MAATLPMAVYLVGYFTRSEGQREGAHLPLSALQLSFLSVRYAKSINRWRLAGAASPAHGGSTSWASCWATDRLVAPVLYAAAPRFASASTLCFGGLNQSFVLSRLKS